MTGKEMKESTLQCNDTTSKLQSIHDLLDLGWWECDLSQKKLTYSPFIARILGLDEKQSGCLNLTDVSKMVREDYRARVVQEVISATSDYVQELKCPVFVNEGQQWIEMRFKRDEKANKIVGLLHPIERREDELDVTAQETVQNLVYQLYGISKSLFTFMQSENLDEMINHVLQSIVTHFSAERAYIFEYYWDVMKQSCIYEAVSRPGIEEIENLTMMFFEPDTWWNQQILAQRPIILSTLDDLPDWDVVDREVLESQDIKSLMVVPFVSQDGTIWGYAGIDMVDKARKWSVDDFQWFSSLMHIVNICIELSKTKARIQHDKEYLQKLYHHMPIGFLPSRILYDEQGQAIDFEFTHVNKEVERITGLSAEQIVGRKGSKSSVFRDLPIMLDVVNTDKHIELELELPNKKHLRVIKFSLEKDEVISLLLDVTETHNAHNALEENEKLLRTIYDNLSVGIELYDKDGFLVQHNEKALEILGLNESGPTDNFNIFDHPMIHPDVKRRVRRGESVDFALNYDFDKLKGFFDADFPDKPLQNLTVKLAPVLDNNNVAQYFLGIIINNTETTNAYLRIQEFEDYFSLIANLAKVGYFKWNQTTNEGFAISQWFLNLGKPANSLLSNDLHDLFEHLHPEDFDIVADFYDKASRGEAKSFEHELRVIEPEGKTKWMRCTITVRESDDSDTHELIGVSYDITELKEMILAKDKAEALDRLKSAFLANMSHEIRTPLNSIIGFSDLLAETDDEEERKEFIAIIQRNNELLLKLVSDILDLSKIESGTFDYIKMDFDAHTMSTEIIRSFNNKARNEEVELLFDESLPSIQMNGDQNRVKQVLMNFITNAMKFTKQGYIKLGYEQRPDDFVYFYVEDTGSGISEDNLGRVFERFVKLNSFVQGTGLGLSICKSLIEQMGGYIGVESEEGKGSRFWFVLPRA